MSATIVLPPIEDVSLSEEVNIDETLFSLELSVDDLHLVCGSQSNEVDTCPAMNEATWVTLYPDLQALAQYLVHKYPLPCWRGQEDDMAEDIVQETVRRMIERAQKAERGEASPIQSLKKMATTVAYNYFRDLKRRDFRLSRLDTTDPASIQFSLLDEYSDECLLDMVADKVDRENLFKEIAAQVAHFPPKQKQAILTDLANRMYFDPEATALEKAFREVGIELHSYRRALPGEHRERSRHISLSSQAYKRLNYLSCWQGYESEECASVTYQTNTSETKERVETNMMPPVPNPNEPIQTEDITEDPPATETETNEEVVTQNPDISGLISTLSEPYRTSLHLYKVEKKSYQEIANHLGVPIGTVKSHVSRGMKMLRKRMEMNEVDGQMVDKDTEEAPLSIEHALAQTRIPQPYQKFLHSHYVEKQTYVAIAASFQCPIGTVKSYISRGKKFLAGL